MVSLLPELRVRVAEALTPTWEATEAFAGHDLPPPFWAFVWPGSHALARLLLDRPELVRGKRVFDFGSGGGLAAIAAVLGGAARVTAGDLDPLAAEAQRLNAELNHAVFESLTGDVVGQPLEGVEVVLAGDVCYERFPSLRIEQWLRQLAGRGVEVLLADPGRAYAPASGLQEVARYEVPTLHELENKTALLTVVWRYIVAP